MASVKTPSPLTPRPRRVRGLVQEIVEGLAADLQAGHIQPGDKLPTEAALMDRFDVSRTVVREAISKLQASKRVETRHGIGTFALPAADSSNFKIATEDLATVNDVIAVLELRIGLEAEAAGWAAQRRTEANLVALTAALEAFEQSIEQDSDAVPPDFQFHMEVARATQNPHFTDLMTYLGAMIIPRTRVNTPRSEPEGRYAYLKRVHSEHERILEAIRQQNVDAARAAMRHHLNNSRERLHQSQTQANVSLS